jgi:uncharacterized peroxidase-related enzyme
MRLKKLEQFLKGRPEPDVVRVLSYRHEMFGTPFSICLEDVMRGPSEWSVGERELFAAFVSRKNQCPFWTGSHSAVASEALGDAFVTAVLDDWRTAAIDQKLRTTLTFLEKLTLTPGDIGRDDIAPMRMEGVSDQAIEDAIYVCTYFNIIDRIADSLDFEVLSAETFGQRAGNFLRNGYLWEAMGRSYQEISTARGL